MTNSATHLKLTVYTSLLVALIAVGAVISIPIGPVPVVLQNMFVLLAGILLGPIWGFYCITVYLIIGFAGLPVFAGGTSGIGKLFGPTGGYLLAYLPCIIITGAVSRGLGKKMVADIFAMVAGSLIVYAIGVCWLAYFAAIDLSKAMAVGLYPFILPDAVKIAVAALMAKSLRPIMKL